MREVVPKKLLGIELDLYFFELSFVNERKPEKPKKNWAMRMQLAYSSTTWFTTL
jgi:hypothetical protein